MVVVIEISPYQNLFHRFKHWSVREIARYLSVPGIPRSYTTRNHRERLLETSVRMIVCIEEKKSVFSERVARIADTDLVIDGELATTVYKVMSVSTSDVLLH